MSMGFYEDMFLFLALIIYPAPNYKLNTKALNIILQFYHKSLT